MTNLQSLPVPDMTRPEGKPAPADAGIHELILERWSPRAFSSAAVSAADLRSLMEAARWAPSSMNEQPWSFIVADLHRDPEAHARIVSTLVPLNAAWARHAPVLIAAAARLTRANGALNRHALYDTGQAVAQLALQATALGLAVHQMGGFDEKQARDLLGIPGDHEPVVVLAIGYPGDPNELSPELLRREVAPRQRRPASQFVYSGVWGSPWLATGIEPQKEM